MGHTSPNDIPPREKLPLFMTSMQQASSTLGIPIEFVKWAKGEGCKAFRKNKIYCDDLKAWCADMKNEFSKAQAQLEAEMQGGGGEGKPVGTTAEVNRERIISMRKQQRKLDREHEVAMGVLVEKDKCKDRMARIIGSLTGILKKTLSREDYNAVARQFQKVNFDL